MIANALAIALLNAWAMPPVEYQIRQLSWVTILILVYSMIAPEHAAAHPRRVSGGRLDGSALLLGRRTCSGFPRRRRSWPIPPLLAELCVCR